MYPHCRGEEYDASTEIEHIKDSLARHKNDLHALLHDRQLAGQDDDGNPETLESPPIQDQEGKHIQMVKWQNQNLPAT